jgi:hypothetical protein
MDQTLFGEQIANSIIKHETNRNTTNTTIKHEIVIEIQQTLSTNKKL